MKRLFLVLGLISTAGLYAADDYVLLLDQQAASQELGGWLGFRKPTEKARRAQEALQSRVSRAVSDTGSGVNVAYVEGLLKVLVGNMTYDKLIHSPIGKKTEVLNRYSHGTRVDSSDMGSGLSFMDQLEGLKKQIKYISRLLNDGETRDEGRTKKPSLRDAIGDNKDNLVVVEAVLREAYGVRALGIYDTVRDGKKIGVIHRSFETKKDDLEKY